jgi:hypothetical protein
MDGRDDVIRTPADSTRMRMDDAQRKGLITGLVLGVIGGGIIGGIIGATMSDRPEATTPNRVLGAPETPPASMPAR